MMKKRCFMIIAALLLLSLTFGACGTSEDEIAGTIKDAESNTADKSENNTESEEDRPLSLGGYEGGIYTNEYLGIECNLDSNWSFYSAEELQELPDSVKDAMSETDIGEAMKDIDQIMDMKAENIEELAAINIVYTKTDLKERLYVVASGEEALVDSVLEQSDAMKEGYEAAGILVNDMKKVKVEFLGEERYAVWTSAVTEDIDYYTLQLFDYTKGQYSATLTVASYVDDRTEDLLNLFYEID